MAGQLELEMRKAGMCVRKGGEAVWELKTGRWFFCEDESQNARKNEEHALRMEYQGAKVVRVKWTPAGWHFKWESGEVYAKPPVGVAQLSWLMQWLAMGEKPAKEIPERIRIGE